MNHPSLFALFLIVRYLSMCQGMSQSAQHRAMPYRPNICCERNNDSAPLTGHIFFAPLPLAPKSAFTALPDDPMTR